MLFRKPEMVNSPQDLLGAWAEEWQKYNGRQGMILRCLTPTCSMLCHGNVEQHFIFALFATETKTGK